MSNELPFHLISKMEDALALADDSLEQMELCCKLVKKLTKLNECERKGNSTRVMLILAKYGSKTRFIDRIANAVTEFGKKLEYLETDVEELKEMVEAKSYQCPKCHGTGSLSKLEYVRERGAVQSVLRSHHCDNCNGKGEVAILPGAETYLSLFLEMANKLVLFLKNFRKALNVFTGTY